jgi:mRNA interferase MazF
MDIKRFDILSHAATADVKWLVISPDEMNDNIRTVIVAPLLPGAPNKPYPTRPRVQIRGREHHVVLDQPRTLEKHDAKPSAKIDPTTGRNLLRVLADMFTF